MKFLNNTIKSTRIFFCSKAGFNFDYIPNALAIPPSLEQKLDESAMCSLKQLKLPNNILKKVENLFKSFGSKQDIEKVGKYLSKKLHSRSSVELPRVLHSVALPLRSTDRNVASNLLKSIGSNQNIDLEELPQDSKIYLESLSRAEDSRHKLYKMTYFPEAALAMVGQRLAGMYASHYRILSEIRNRVPSFIPRKMLEFNAGFAPSTLAAHSIWDNSFVDALAIESSENLSQIGEYLCQDIPYIRWQYNMYKDTQKFDLISCNYGMCNISDIESRRILIRNLWSRLSLNGMLVIVEPGTPTGFRNIFTIRELFISELSSNKFHFLAPCPHENSCPMALTGKDWCHFSQRINHIPKHLYRKSRKISSKNYEDEKFSFIVIVKGEGPRSIFKKEENAQNLKDKSYFWPRIVLPVIKKGKHTLIDVCSYPQSFERLIVTKNSPEAAGYKFARKAMWGDLWRFPKRLIRPEARDYGPEEVRNHLKNLTEKVIKNKDYKSEISEDLIKTFESKTIQHYGT